MTNTSPLSFKAFMAACPKENLKSSVFLPVHRDRKFPEVPKDTKIKLDDGTINPAVRIYPAACLQRLKNGHNIAIYGMPGGLMFLDMDVENGKLKASKEFINSIPNTFTVKTRNGGLQYYYLNHSNSVNMDLFENGTNIGELRATWQYVVGVGSYVEPDANNFDGTGTYRVITNILITAMPDEFLARIKTTMINDKTKDSIPLTPKQKVKVIDKSDYLENLIKQGKTYKRLI